MIKRFSQHHHYKLIQNQIQFQIEVKQISTIIDACKQFAIVIKFQAGYYYIKNNHNRFKKWLKQQDQQLLAKIFFNHHEQILVFQPVYDLIISKLLK